VSPYEIQQQVAAVEKAKNKMRFGAEGELILDTLCVILRHLADKQAEEHMRRSAKERQAELEREWI
jgi:hypothetical protein